MSIFLACTYKCLVLLVNCFAASMEFEDAANWMCVVHYRVGRKSVFDQRRATPVEMCQVILLLTAPYRQIRLSVWKVGLKILIVQSWKERRRRIAYILAGIVEYDENISCCSKMHWRRSVMKAARPIPLRDKSAVSRPEKRTHRWSASDRSLPEFFMSSLVLTCIIIMNHHE